MLFRNHVEEPDQTAAEPGGQLLKPEAQRALASDAAAEPVLGVPDVVLTFKERRDRLVVSAVAEIATPRAEISEPQAGSIDAVVLRGCPTSDHGFEVIATPRVGAVVANRGVAVIPAFTQVGSTA